ncbi:MAG: homoserine O-succinyltransferase [Flavobacterium sp.]|jgi:GMP synthase-like glutamine amidotransferase|uniref:Homoserine O-succinyltransferase n=1 Tax=Flavobacterium algoritolerans TaxID=3041254 RepID=A0ABT6VDJ2_9FLAO|nr:MULTISPECIES: homoserine O-succinyltransferase [Flavobacterium]MDI5888714.1 homoserine O-succinyltransferase [Flavobacterium yafengii]MDI5895850.1 homoserine O-succinyltransferase [Flavobacterium algoritolerans]MDI6048937.1 homoserine O-succinyltransferase [Flavobacterium sp. XS2P24]MDP3681421.1 homoserine O-succinyltransferase [Flavobacterium sp.]MDZ4328999.1 homoserine O-succinyltransferase [Flavobacterium sp.]
MSNKIIKIALLDMYKGEPNQGMRCIIDVVNRFSPVVSFEIFDVRVKCELPDIKEFDIYISTGGPGNPLIGDGNWDVKYYAFIDSLNKWNSENAVKKHVLFICHSFQMACLHFGLATVTRRNDTSFGVMTIHKTKEGVTDPLFEGLADPFYAIDSRDYQVVQPKLSVFAKKGAKIISLEKIRDHVQYERAIMAVRFTDYFVGTQFHPEADPISFVSHLRNKQAKEKIRAMKGKRKFRNMLEDLLDDDKIYRTNETLIPNFLRTAINDLMKTKKMLSN